MSIKRIKTVADWVSRRITAYMLMGLVLTVTYQVFARQLLKISTPWTEEMSKNFLIWSTFIGAISLYIRGENLIVDIMAVHYTPLLRHLMRILVNLFALVIAGSLAYFGYKLCTNRMILNSVTIGMEVSRVWMYVVMPISMVFLWLMAAMDTYESVVALFNKSYLPSPKGEGEEGQC